MPTPTYVPLATITLTATDSEIIFSSIPATFRDLIVVVAATAGATVEYPMRFNSVSSTIYAQVMIRGQSSGASSGSGTENGIYTANRVSSTVSNHIYHIFDYAQTDKHKTVLNRANNTGSDLVTASAARWPDTSAITSISITTVSSSFSIGSTFSLYGVN